MENKKEEYKRLVGLRKSCGKCGQHLANPSIVNAKFDSEEIGAWSLWQNSLEAKILVVGQDWGDIDYYIKSQGVDSDSNPTNRNLMKLFQSIGINIGYPSMPKYNDDLFFTNAILCLKSGGMSAKILDQCYERCGKLFLKPLVNIIRPTYIIALGKKAYETLCKVYGVRVEPFKDIVDRRTPIKLTSETLLFPVYHCGAHGVNINRKFPEQQKDWEAIGRYLQERTK